jgi:hypothetical protein
MVRFASSRLDNFCHLLFSLVAAFGLTLLMTRPLDGVVGLLVAGPFWGMLLSVLGIVLSFFAPEKEKKKLLLANAMFLLLSVLSVVPPN